MKIESTHQRSKHYKRSSAKKQKAKRVQMFLTKQIQWLLLLPVLTAILINRGTSAFMLITFDVDGTLVRGSGQAADTSAHAKAFSHAVGQVLGDGQNPTIPVAQALPGHKFHGSTDGLILLRLARAAIGVEPMDSVPKLEEMFDCMYEFISQMDDEEISEGINALPGVLDTLSKLATMKESVACGLVTGNVEGIARRKMRAVGITATHALSPPCLAEQLRNIWPGAEHLAFLGGFGSDYCSGNIDDDARNYLDRAEQINIAARRCRQNIDIMNSNHDNINSHDPPKVLRRLVHVGDAPADVLAAKTYAEKVAAAEKEGGGADENENSIVVGMVGVATGSYSADLLRELAGTPVPGVWEPVILENGMADPDQFLAACGVDASACC